VSTSYTAWGWFQLVVGVVVAIAGVALFSGSTWSRVTAVTVAGLSGIVNLMFMSASPWWSLTALALDVLVIYAVTVHGAEARRR
jgi:phosphatidylserine synthase